VHLLALDRYYVHYACQQVLRLGPDGVVPSPECTRNPCWAVVGYLQHGDILPQPWKDPCPPARPRLGPEYRAPCTQTTQFWRVVWRAAATLLIGQEIRRGRWVRADDAIKSARQCNSPARGSTSARLFYVVRGDPTELEQLVDFLATRRARPGFFTAPSGE